MDLRAFIFNREFDLCFGMMFNRHGDVRMVSIGVRRQSER